jgi:hypothetical protein
MRLRKLTGGMQDPEMDSTIGEAGRLLRLCTYKWEFNPHWHLGKA